MKKIVIISLSSMLGLFIALGGVQLWLASRLRRVIDGVEVETSAGVYGVEVKSVSVNLLERSVRVKDITLKADTVRSPGAHLTPVIINFSAGKIKASGVEIGRLLKNPTDISLGGLRLTNPQITVTSYPAPDSPADGATPNTARADEGRSGSGFRLAVDNIEIENGLLELRRRTGERTETFLMTGLNLQAEGFSTDTLSGARRLKYFDAVTAFAPCFRYIPADESLIVRVDSLAADSRAGTLRTGSVSVEPQYDKTVFAYRSGGDWTRVRVAGLGLFGVSYGGFIGGGALVIDSVAVGRTDVVSYKDRNVVQTPRVKKLFYEQVQGVPFPLTVRTIRIPHVDAVYEELPAGGHQPGTISFGGLAGTVTGLSNVADSDDPFFRLAAGGSIYGAGRLDAVFVFPKTAQTNRFEVEGMLGAFDMTLLNAVVMPLLGAEVNGGEVNRMSFHIVGTAAESSSELTLLYDGLDIAFVKERRGRVHERKVLSWIVNEMVLLGANPEHGTTRQARGHAERDFNKSQFNYLWKSLQPAVMATLGAPGKDGKTKAKRNE